MALVLKTAAVLEPVTLAEAKSHLRVDTTDDDTLIATLIKVARTEAETIMHGGIITQEWELVLDTFPTTFTLPLHPLATVDSVKYKDENGVEQTLNATTYQVDSENLPAKICLADGEAWPAISTEINAVRVRHTIGYGADGSFVPDAIKHWILIKVAALYENREGGAGLNVGFADRLLDDYRGY